MRFVAIAARILAVMPRMRVTRHVCGEFGQTTLSNVVAACVQAEFSLARVAVEHESCKVALRQRVHVVSSDPFEALGYLLFNSGLMTSHATLAHVAVQAGEHCPGVFDIIAPFVDSLLVRIGVERIEVF